MTRYLLDSGILGHLVNRRQGIRERCQLETRKGNIIGIGVPVLAELVYGIEYGENRDRNMRSLHSVLPSITVWPFDKDAAFEYGRLHAELRRTGRPMQVIDIMIAAIALTLGKCTVVSTDSDLLAIPGLTVENWTV
ncbi:type II toxin-antitoxin system VapC family toxin [Zavarzinella formosa]|uniref:type II toxin-antitoxin system VapC family toxin n=1 Tax=Zavarzinella formosa TaxID=360055 RepID=UPI0002E42916|nr:type II toxin-antitoxin system VapC family toxin [Zavarzinella formosa]